MNEASLIYAVSTHLDDGFATQYRPICIFVEQNSDILTPFQLKYESK